MLGRRTLIVEADSASAGSASLLAGRTSARSDRCYQVKISRCPEAIQLTTIGRLSVLPYGQALNRPSTVTESSSMQVLLESLSREYDLVLVDYRHG